MDKSKLREQLKKMEFRDWLALLRLALAFIPGKLYRRMFSDTWMITEYRHLARDNGYWLFKYVRENFPDKRVYYPISKDSPDYEKISRLGNTIKFGGVKHYILFWGVSKFIGTTKYYGFPYGRICEDFVQWNFHSFKNVFLNHGVARGYSSIVDARETNYDLIFAISPVEKEIMVHENFQDPEKIRCVGFCRHDNLDDSLLQKNRIVIMPTWRNWLDFRLEVRQDKIDAVTAQFLQSDYYRLFNRFINSPELISYIEANNLEIIFYLHEYAQAYCKYFSSPSKNIVVGRNTDYDIQNLLKSAALLITDYSTVSYDFAYMYKPVLYYQFDLDQFEENQYREGEAFSYEENGFGKVVRKEEDLVREIKNCHRQNFLMEEQYRKRVDAFFPYHDKENCRRIYEEIERLS